MKKIIICLIVGLYVASFTVNISGETYNKEEFLTARLYIEDRPIVPILTEDELKWDINTNSNSNPIAKPGNGKGKPPKPPNPPKPPEDPPDGVLERWAICIGISDYEGTGDDLNYCDDDAREWKNFLTGEGYTVVLLIDNQATASNIEAEITDLLSNEDGDDYVVFTYSGHGLKYRKYGSCMLSHDKYLIPHKWLKSKFDNADSTHIYFTLDACEIGGFRNSISANRVGAFASNNKLSYEDPNLQNGVFTYYQIVGWNTYNNFEDDAAYAIQGMQNWANQYPSITVDPFFVDNFEGTMVP